MKQQMTTLFATLVLAGCASAPEPYTPSGSNRVHVNAAGRMSVYQQEVTAEENGKAERSRLQGEIQRLQQSVKDLQAFISRKFVEVEANTPRGVPVPGSKPAQPTVRVVPDEDQGLVARAYGARTQPAYVSPLPKAAEIPQEARSITRPSAGLRPSEHVEMHNGRLVISIDYGNGESDFSPSAELTRYLVEAAKSADVVEVRGYAVGDRSGKGWSGVVATARAVKVIRYLAEKGIPREKIQVFTTVDPNAQRRVEVRPRAMGARAAAAKQA